MAAADDPVKQAFEILMDCSQLCKMIRGETEACAFNSTCSEIFTAVAMQYLCCPDPALSNPAKVLLPLVLSEFGDAQDPNGTPANQAELQDPNPSLLLMMKEKEKEVAELQAQLQAEEKKVSEQLSAMQLQEKETQIAQLNARLQEQEKNTSSQERGMAAQFSSRLQEQEQTIAQLSARLQEQDQALSVQLKAKLQEQENAITAQVKSRLQEQERRVAEKEAECKSLESKSNALAQALEAKSIALARALQSQTDQPERKTINSTTSLVQSGVQVIAAAELDLDLANGSKTLLGTGVYSEVYATTRRVAVKAFRGRFSQQRFREFKQEAEVLQSVQAVSGVIKLHGICIDSLPNLYLVMEPALGGSLEALMQRHKGRGLALETACVLARNIAAIMRDVHGKGVVHRDLKPSNCLLTDYDRHAIKLVDFGLARALSGAQLDDAEEDGAGTPMFQAPEALQGSGVGLKADVYSFGITLWEMVTGGTPFEELSLAEMKAAVVAGARPPIHAGVNEEVGELLKWCWAADAGARPHFGQVVQKLDLVLGQLSPQSTAQREPANEGRAPYRAPTDNGHAESMEEM